MLTKDSKCFSRVKGKINLPEGRLYEKSTIDESPGRRLSITPSQRTRVSSMNFVSNNPAFSVPIFLITVLTLKSSPKVGVCGSVKIEEIIRFGLIEERARIARAVSYALSFHEPLLSWEAIKKAFALFKLSLYSIPSKLLPSLSFYQHHLPAFLISLNTYKIYTR